MVWDGEERKDADDADHDEELDESEAKACGPVHGVPPFQVLNSASGTGVLLIQP